MATGATVAAVPNLLNLQPEAEYQNISRAANAAALIQSTSAPELPGHSAVVGRYSRETPVLSAMDDDTDVA
ncbi:MAG: hypothetical protein QOH45_1041, partial [Pseudonocardiales bacterium]|nr:hypothetical protein [Pseudonocardiales bacterium]